MADDTSVEPRVMDLEIKVAFLERSLEDLDSVVRELADELVRTRKALEEVEGKLAATTVDNDMDAEASLLYEKPPHY